MGNGQNNWEMAYIHGARLKHLRIGLTKLEMSEEFDKWLKYLGNDVYIWELPSVFEKRPKYLGNDVDLWEMSQICGEMT